jgi:hypothetical protein
MKKTLYLALALLALLLWRDWSGREITHPPGVLVPEAPLQRQLAEPRVAMLGDYRLTRRAAFDIRARVLSREDYRWGAEAELSPTDLALGWGEMSDQAVLDRIDISQSGRWYYTRYALPPPIPDHRIVASSGNMHMIPANDWVGKKLRQVRAGDIVRARGFLVDVDHDSGFFWRTSLSRQDSGAGSCEIFYLEQLYIETQE